jgi:hypothetical protein
MADQYDNKNRGSLFKNDRKELDTHPDYNGSINIEGTDYWLNGWLKESKKDGKKFFSLSVKPKDQAAGKSPVKAKSAPAKTRDEDSEIPF